MKKALMLCLAAVAAVALSVRAEKVDVSFGPAGADGIPKGWAYHGWEGYFPKAKAELLQQDGKPVFHLFDANGRSGAGVLTSVRVPCHAGDIIHVAYSVRGKGRAGARTQQYTDKGAANNGGGNAFDLTDDWQRHEFTVAANDSTAGTTAFFNVGVHCTKGSDAYFRDLVCEIRRQYLDDYEDASLKRAGAPEIISDIIAPGLMSLTKMGLYRTETSSVIPLGDDALALPELTEVNPVLETGFRVYSFGRKNRVDGRLTLALAAGDRRFSLAVDHRASAKDLACSFADADGRSLGQLAVPYAALPADFILTVSKSGAFSLAVKSLADSSTHVKTGTSAFLKGLSEPLKASLTLAKTGAAPAETVLDRVFAGRGSPEEQPAPAPYKVDVLPTFDPVKAGWPLAFSDEFDGAEIDGTKWYCTDPARDWRKTGLAYVTNGVLHILADWDEKREKLRTASLWSTYSQTYGYFEAKLRFTQKNGWWAAFWLYGCSDSNPFVDGFEIDIFEDYYTRDRDPQAPRKGILDHNLHILNGSHLKSWNYNSQLPGSLDDFYVLGCKWTPFEISYYLNGKLIASKSTHSSYNSVTFDAITHAAGITPLHAIVSGQVMGPSWSQFDKTGVTFPEHYLVDYVRIYAYPDAPKERPSILLNVDRDQVMVKAGSTMKVKARPVPAAGTYAPVKTVYLFDNGYLLDYKTEAPYEFDVTFSPESFAKTRFMKPGRSGIKPPFGSFPHVFSVFAQDERGRVSHSETFTRIVADAASSKPYRGQAQAVPGVIRVGRYDEGGKGVAYYDSTDANVANKTWRPQEGPDCSEDGCGSVAGGEWLNYTVDVQKSGRYAVDFTYGTPDRTTFNVALLLDGRLLGRFACHGHDNESWRADTVATLENVWLPCGRHRITLLLEGRCNFSNLAFRLTSFSNVSDRLRDAIGDRRLGVSEPTVTEGFESATSAVFPSAEIVRDIVSPGLLATTGQGLFRKGVTRELPEARLPAASNRWFATGVRFYGFGQDRRCPGKLSWRFAAADRTFTVSVEAKDDKGDLECRLTDGKKGDIAFLSLPYRALPADLLFAANGSGEVELTASSLSESSFRRLSGETDFFRTPFRGTFAIAADEARIDNFAVGAAQDEMATDSVPFTIERAKEFDPVKAGWKKVFADEFDGDAVDWTKWYLPAWGGKNAINHVRVRDGKLHIECDWDKNHKSLETASMRTRQAYPFGYFEARLKVTKNSGWWAAFWLYGVSNANPLVDGFEIDIFEDYYTRSDRPEGPHRGILDHNLHVYIGSLLKSWNYGSTLPGSVDDFFTIGCKYTPFEISYYLNGKLIGSKANHSPYDSVTFDGFSHCFGTAPLHAIVSGQIMRPTNTWGKKDTTGFTFPEDYVIDYVRIYEYPNDAADRPTVTWTKRGCEKANVPVGSVLTFAADVKPAANGGAPIKAAYLFDNGYMLACRTEAPWTFEIPYTKEFFDRTRYMRPGRQKVVPDFCGYTQGFEIFVQDANGKVSGSGVEFKYPDFGASKPKGGVARTIPGKLLLKDHDEGGEGVSYAECGATGKPNFAANGSLCGIIGGEWLKYTVDVAETGDYVMTLHAEVGPTRVGSELLVYVDDVLATRYAFEPNDLMTAKYAFRDIPAELTLTKGRHVLRLVGWTESQLQSLDFRLKGTSKSGVVPSGLSKATLDAGGTTFDFKACSDRRFKLDDIPADGAAGNLIPADDVAAPLPSGYQKWHPFTCFNHASLPPNSSFRGGMHKHVEMKRADGVFSVSKGEAMRAFCSTNEYDNLHCCAEGTWRKYVRLPDAKGGAYRLSLRYKMRHTAPQTGYGTYGLIIIHSWTLTPDGKGYKHVDRPACPSLVDSFADWVPTFVDFDVPAGADVISIQIRHDGLGDLLAKDVYLARQKAKSANAGMTIRLSPAQLVDNAFAVSEGQCGQLTWEWRKETDEAFDAKDSEFRLALPAGFAFLGDTFADSADVAANPDGSSLVTFKVGRQRVYVPSKKLTSWNKPAVLVRSTDKPGTEGLMSLSAWRKGVKTGDSGPVRLFTIPAIKTTSPTRYLYAAMPGASQTINFHQEEACAAYARFLTDIGIRQLASENGGWIDWKHADTYKREFRAGGGRRITPCWGGIANGNYIGNHNDTPEGDRFVTDGKPTGDWAGYVSKGVCPLMVTEERPYFKEKVLPGLAKRLKGCDGLRANWEPFMFVHRGCYCEKCRAAFAKWAKLDEAALTADWPKKVKVDGTYGKQWIRFRSRQQAEVVKVINRHVMRLTGGADSLGFIPAITWREMNSTWPQRHPSPESEPIDYAGEIPTVGTWGPYVIWDAEKPYHYSKRGPLIHFIASKDVREQTDRDYPKGRRPRLLGGTQGLQCGEWICQPEWLEMAMDSYFFNGFQGTQAYFFPEGLDARYAAAYARSAARAAKYENAVWDGVRHDASVTLTPVKEYALPSTRVSDYIPAYRDVPMIQSAVYDLNGVKTVAVLNFWEGGAAFFDLKASGLVAGGYVLVDEKGVLYAKDRNRTSWTAEEFAAGVRLQVGAARTRVFEIRPVADVAFKDVTAVLTAADLADAYESAKPALEKAAAADAAYEASEGGRLTRDTKAEI